MAVLDCRAPRSAVMDSARSRSFVAFGNDALLDLLNSLAGRVVTKRSCTPERLRP